MDEELRRFCAQECVALVDGWAALDPELLVVKPLHGGLTNKLYKVSLQPASAGAQADAQADAHTASSPVAVVCRLYGKDVGVFFERSNETIVIEYLCSQGLGLDFVRGFQMQEMGDGRVESFIEGHTLHRDQLHEAKFSMRVAEWMAVLHSLDVPVSKTCALFESNSTTSTTFPYLVAQNLHAWSRAAKPTLESGGQDMWSSLSVKPNSSSPALTFDAVEVETAFLEEFLPQFESPVVFCHNDLQEGNIIHEQAADRTHVIDFEYSSYNYRGFDLANHWAEMYIDNQHGEWPYFVLDSAQMPSKEQQLAFLRRYLSSSALLPSERPFTRSEADKEAADTHPEVVAEAALQALRKEVEAFLLAPHLMWCLWAIIQSSNSDIEFGYLDYALARWNEFHRLKQRLLPAA